MKACKILNGFYKCDGLIAQSLSEFSAMESPGKPETRTCPAVPKLVSRRTGSLVTWVVDRGGAPPNSPAPRTRESSPQTPPFKPSFPRLTCLSPSPKNPKSPRHPFCTSPKSDLPKSPPSHRETSRETSPDTRCSLPSSSGEGPTPVWPVFVPWVGVAMDPMVMANAMAHYQLQVCKKAQQLAQARGAPNNETCVVGCCCSRCIGIPAAFRPTSAEAVEASQESIEVDSLSSKKDEKEEDVASTTSMSSDESLDLEVPFPPSWQTHAKKQLTWCTRDFRLRAGLPYNKVNRTIVCSKLHSDTSAIDVQQAFEQRFRAMPDFRHMYFKKGQGSGILQFIARQTGLCSFSKTYHRIGYFSSLFPLFMVMCLPGLTPHLRI